MFGTGTGRNGGESGVRVAENKIRIIFSDIDGTLLNSSHQITDQTRAKILELEEYGIPFVLVSARMPEGVQAIQYKLGNHAPIVCYSGGLIYDEHGNVLHSCQMELKLALEIKHLLTETYPDICCNAYGYQKWVVDDPDNNWVKKEEAITGLTAIKGDLREEFLTDNGIHKFLLMGEPEQILTVSEIIKACYPELSVAASNSNYLEVMPGSVRKSAGVKLLCQYYKVEQDMTMAFGDGQNDIDMLKAVKYSYAMANAAAEVKQAASFMTLTNDEDGVYHIISTLL